MSEEIPIAILHKLQMMRQEDLRALVEKERDLSDLIKTLNSKQVLRLSLLEENSNRMEVKLKEEISSIRSGIGKMDQILSELNLSVHGIKTKMDASDKITWKFGVPILLGFISVVVSTLLKNLLEG